MGTDAKKALRRVLTETAAAIPPQKRRAYSEAVTRAVLESGVYRNARSVFVYVSTPTEPDTRAIIENALEAGKRVYAPYCVNGQTMLAVPLASIHALAPGRFGIPAPPLPAGYVPPRAIDLTVTPCAAAAENGARLGHGAGYYDRFFAATQTYKLCLCFSTLLLPALPEEPFDVRMDAIVTENGFLRRG